MSNFIIGVLAMSNFNRRDFVKHSSALSAGVLFGGCRSNPEKKNLKTHNYEAEIELDDSYDVIVAGAGTAGCLAALSAAREGKRVLLLEDSGRLGGMMTRGNAGLTKFIVHTPTTEGYDEVIEDLQSGDRSVSTIGGLTREFIDGIIEDGTALGTYGYPGSYVIPDPYKLKRRLFEMMKREGVDVLLHASVFDVIMDDSKIAGLVVRCVSKRKAFKSKMIIDCTGDGDVSYLAGAPFNFGVTKNDWTYKEKGVPVGTTTTMGAMYRVCNVDLKKCLKHLKKNPDLFVEHGFSKMSFEQIWECVNDNQSAVFRVSDGEKVHQIYNSTVPGVCTLCCSLSEQRDGTSSESLTKAEYELLEVTREMVERMRKYIPGFENASIVDCPEVGIRETRHIMGKYVLDGEEVLKSVQFEDSIGRGSHPVDTHFLPERFHNPDYKKRWSYSIPYGCLVPLKIENLFVAGRCVSCSYEAAGAIRPTATCMVLGEAAGLASAVCVDVKQSPRNLEYKYLKPKLMERGIVV